jgi:hypothetical protein
MKDGMRLLLLASVSLMASGCQPGGGNTKPAEKGSAPPTPSASEAIRAEGLHNVYRITDKLLSGSGPEGEEGFRSLQRLGVRTVISVDGSRPDVEIARRYDLRYVHLPIGYDGMSRRRALELARAVHDLPGLVYIHCHHGQHRGPAAAAVVHLCLDETCTVEQALAEMRRAGTDPRYTGLYSLPKELARPTARELDRVAADYPEVAAVSGLTQLMATIDFRWEHLKQVRAAGWKPPPRHPDLDPPHEALQLLEQFREARRLPQVKERPADFQHQLAAAEEAAAALESALRQGKQGTRTIPATVEAFRKIGASCADCHARYRDVPQRP